MPKINVKLPSVVPQKVNLSKRKSTSLKKQHISVVFCLDVSGSMANRVNDKRKIDHLRDVVANYPKVRRVSFSTDVYYGRIPEPQMLTRMDSGLRAVGRLPCVKKILLVSDGRPDSEEDAMNAALSLKMPICTIYIGYPSERGDQFLASIAAATGGRHYTATTGADFQHELEHGFEILLLEGPNGHRLESSGKAIRL